MKDQLKKLKDMLDIVKTTENIMEKENTNASAMAQASSCDIRLLSENFMDKDMQKPPVQNDNNVLRHDNTTDNQPKEVNKKTRYESSKGVKSKSPTIKEKLALQVELEAKKKELEAIMGKHKASTSNLNHDIGVDGKSEFSCTSNAINEAWIPLISPQNNYADSDRFSNGECPDDVNGYSELQDNPNILSSNTSKYRSEIHPRGDYSPSEFDRLQNLYPTSQRNVKSSYVATSSCIREPRTNSEEDDRTKVQKQLQLIKSVCDSMLEEQTANISPNVQHMQNNLIPSYFSEPHRFILPNQHTLNTLNFINSTGDMPCFSRNTNLNLDISNYQNWLATNTIQTQSFMLNTLNQCCQMLWLQQRELTSLKTAVTMLQERVENIPFGGAQERIPSSLHTTPQDHRVGSHYRPVPNPKVNQVSSAFSLPNLNNYNVPSSNLELNYNQNNIHGGRLLDPSLNNINVNHLNPHQGIEHANNLLHGVNSNINTVPNQMWNGQALNNQVTPGNRSNNYWANFRR